MPPGKKVVISLGWVASATYISAAISFGGNIFLVRLLTPEDFGVLALAGAFATFLAVPMRLGVPGAVTRFYFDHRGTEGLSDYVKTIERFLFANGFLIGIIAVAVSFVAGVPITFPRQRFLSWITIVCACVVNFSPRTIRFPSSTVSPLITKSSAHSVFLKRPPP